MSQFPPSSPLSSPPPTQSFSRGTVDDQSPSAKHYRPKNELPFELAQHVQTYYEENLFSQAYQFLLSITANSGASVHRHAPVTVPPPAHLALAATVAVHPVFTTRTHVREKWEQANAAVRLLRLVHDTVGPVSAGFSTTFTFRKYDSRATRRSGLRYDEGDDPDAVDDHRPADRNLNTPFAGPQSLWGRAEDFWQLVGWAFNCSCLPGIHAARWHHYSVLLAFLVDVLETDWDLHTTSAQPSPDDTLLWHYIELSAGGHARGRRAVRAIFADGSPNAMSHFREIFPNELKEPARDEARPKKREVDVNIDQDIYGDYMGHEDSELSDYDAGDAASPATGTGPGGRQRPRRGVRTRTPSSRRVTPRSSTGSLRQEYENGEDGAPVSTPAVATLGDATAIALRLRLLRLLVNVAAHPTLTETSPTTFPDLDELRTLYVEFIKPLPLPLYARVIFPSPPAPAARSRRQPRDAPIFEPSTLTNLCEELLQRLLEKAATSGMSMVLLSQSKLEQQYLPFGASRDTIDANARVSLVLESLVRCLAQSGDLHRTNTLQEMLARGIERRTSVVVDVSEGRRKRLGHGGEEEAWAWLAESGERMSTIVDGLRD